MVSKRRIYLSATVHENPYRCALEILSKRRIYISATVQENPYRCSSVRTVTTTYKTFGEQLFWSLKQLCWTLNSFCDKIKFVTKKVTKSASRKVFSDEFLKMSLKMTISDQFYIVTKCLILQI